MTIQYINVTVGATLANGDVQVSAKGKSAGTQMNHVSVAYDDSVVTHQNQLLAAIRAALLVAQSDTALPRG